MKSVAAAVDYPQAFVTNDGRRSRGYLVRVPVALESTAAQPNLRAQGGTIHGKGGTVSR
jgi:hypothetical protein